MTFIAQTEDGPVVPEETDGSEQLGCVECTESLSIVKSHWREDETFVSRHFRHPPSESCGGGESDTHKAMKSIALSKLKEVYPRHAKATLEQRVGDREADAYLRFSEPHETLGYGVIGEAQYRHKDKDVAAVTQEYLDFGYSVFWLYEDDFEGSDVELGEPVRVWPNGEPEYHPREISEIQTPTKPFPIRKPVLYTAGAMGAAHKGAKWRRSVENQVGNATFVHPEDTYLSHGVGEVGGCVAEDISVVNNADGVVAYFSKPTQNGTLTELLHAVHTNKPTLTVIDPSLFGYKSDDSRYEVQKIEKGVDWVDSKDDYWFLVNYLTGDESARRFRERGVQKGPPDVPVWGGVAGAEVWVGHEDDVSSITQKWVRTQKIPSRDREDRVAGNGGFLKEVAADE